MKIILSRKGFDSSYGGHASPILPDGKMLSLPIPSSWDWDNLGYREIFTPEGKTYQQLIEELKTGFAIGNQSVHLDPDLVRCVRQRKPGWRPAFGQYDKAAGHLRNQGVTKGDLFLFFGWFQYTKYVNGKVCFHGNSKNGFHAIFGFLEIGEIITANEGTKFPNWLKAHPHAKCVYTKYTNNTIFVAEPKLTFDSRIPGGGAFEFNERLRLTKKGYKKSQWNLDKEIFQHLTFSCDENKKKEDVWKDDYYQSPRYPCQEIVIHADEGVKQWASSIGKNSLLWSD